MNGEVQRWSTQDDPLAMAMDEGIDNALDLLASRFIQTETGSDTSSLDLVAIDINGLEDYARVLKYLESLDMVTKVQVLRIEAGRVRFRLTTKVGQAAVAQAISLGRTLSLLDVSEEWTFELLR